MIENIISNLLNNNLLHRMIGVRRKLKPDMMKDLQLMIDYAEVDAFHYSMYKEIYDNRVTMYENRFWDVTPFKGYL